MSDLDLGQTLRVEGVDMDLKTDFWFCPRHGVFVPRLFGADFIDEEGCPVLMSDEEACGEPIKAINMAEWHRSTVRIEVNRKSYQIPVKAISGKALRELAEIPDEEDLLGKGEPHEGELGDDGCYLLPPGQLFHPQEGMEFFSVAKDRTLVFAGIPIEVDPSLAPNRIRLVTGVAEKVFRIEGEEMIEETS